jgi:outer membrane protein TolC
MAVNEETAVRLGVNIPDDLRWVATIVEAPAGEEVERLGLPEAVGLAMAQNPDWQAKRAALQAAAQIAGAARAAYLPQVTARASVNRVDPVDGMDFGDIGSFDHVHTGIYLEQVLFSLPTVHEAQIAGEQRRLDSLSVKQAALDLEYAVAAAYLEYQRAWQMHGVAETYRRGANEALQIAQVHRAQRRGMPAEHIRMEQELMLAMQAKVQAATDLVCAQTVLNTLIGRPGETPLVAISPEANSERLIRQMELLQADGAEDRLVGAAMAGSPRLAAAAGQVRRSELERRKATGSFWPSISLRGRVATVDDISATSGRQFDRNTWSIGLSAELPLFLGGRRFAERKEQVWRLESAEYEQDAAYQHIRGELQVLRYQLSDWPSA